MTEEKPLPRVGACEKNFSRAANRVFISDALLVIFAHSMPKITVISVATWRLLVIMSALKSIGPYLTNETRYYKFPLIRTED